MGDADSLKLSALCLLFLGLMGSPALGQGERVCGLCENDPELMAKNGFVHQSFPFGRSTNEKIAKDLFWPAAWLETPHFRIGINLEPWKVPQSEKKIYKAELEALRDRWPAIRPKIPVLDMDLRLHLVAERAESFYREFVALMGMREQDFTDDEANIMSGWGRYLGEHDKFEIMVFQNAGPFREYMRNEWGLGYDKPQRWNNVDRDCLWIGVNLETEKIRHDRQVHNLLLHCLAHNFLDGFRHYSYELPVWITEGFAHWAEQRNDPRFNLFDTVESTFREKKVLEKWGPEVRRMVVKKEAASFASLLRRASFAELEWEDHLVCWSKVDFLIAQGEGKFGHFMRSLKERRDKKGFPDGSHMDDAQRAAFREHFGWTVPKAEEVWKGWVLEEYPVK